jgi:uncharacterized protein YbjT (DUF2867 family)
MSTTTKPVIAVTGATGHQGGGLVDAVLADPESPYAVRALTRRPESEAARALADRGVEVVAVDMEDAASLAAAFDGAAAAFCVTFFWETMSPEVESRQAEALATAVRIAAVPHVVWSTLPDTRHRFPLDSTEMPTIDGRYKVPHFDAKADANAFFVASGRPTTFINAAFYYDNFINFGVEPRRNADDTLVLDLPLGDGRLPMIAGRDVGHVAYGVIRAGSPLFGADIDVLGEHLTGQGIADALAAAFGEPVLYQPAGLAAYRAAGFPGAVELAGQYQYFSAETERYARVHRSGESRLLAPDLQTFPQWLARNASAIPITAPVGRI